MSYQRFWAFSQSCFVQLLQRKYSIIISIIITIINDDAGDDDDNNNDWHADFYATDNDISMSTKIRMSNIIITMMINR